MDKGTLEIRWHGRGGQGVVTAAKILAESALEEDKYFQALPEYGAERMGAPIRAYTRVSSDPILPLCQVTEPDVVVVLDSSLLSVIDVTEGLKGDGLMLVNTPLPPAEVRSRLGLKGGRVYTVDASRIARDTIGRNIPNSPMLGALVRATGLVDRDTVAGQLRHKMGATMKEELVQANVAAFEQAHEETKEG